jgi:hypothetical protein
MSEQLRALVYPVGEPPEERMIGARLEDFQALVGGLIEMVQLEYTPNAGTVDVVCNEEGLLERLPFNRMVGPHFIVGQFFVVGHDKRGVPRSLTPAEIKRTLAFIG